jgi:hypothetical protein
VVKRLVPVALGVGLVWGCSVPELDLTGKQCPCAAGYVCDVASNVCVAALDGAVGDAPSGDAPGNDAPAGDGGVVHGLDMANLVKLSESAPLLDGPGSTSPDCGKFSIAWAPESNLQTNELIATTFVDPNTKNFWILYTCKDTDVGWSVALASWDRVAPQATILTPKSSGGINPIIGINDIANDGAAVVSLRQTHLVFGGDGQVHGTTALWRNNAWAVLPVSATSPNALSAASMNTNVTTLLQRNGTGWYAKAGLGWETLFYNGTYYLYGLYSDGTSVTSDGNPLSSIGLSTSTDMLTSTFQTTPLATGWTDPLVSYDGGMFHMVARRLDDNNLYYVRGTAPDQFDFAHPQLIDLASKAGGSGAWDELRWPGHPGSDEPVLSSARVIDGTMYLFYMAGSPNDPGASYSQTRRGLGVFTVPVVP